MVSEWRVGHSRKADHTTEVRFTAAPLIQRNVDLHTKDRNCQDARHDIEHKVLHKLKNCAVLVSGEIVNYSNVVDTGDSNSVMIESAVFLNARVQFVGGGECLHF